MWTRPSGLHVVSEMFQIESIYNAASPCPVFNPSCADPLFRFSGLARPRPRRRTRPSTAGHTTADRQPVCLLSLSQPPFSLRRDSIAEHTRCVVRNHVWLALVDVYDFSRVSVQGRLARPAASSDFPCLHFRFSELLET